MRLPRFTTRRLMVLVAVVAVALGGVRLLQLRAAYLGLATSHAADAMLFRDRAIWAMRMSRSRYVQPSQVESLRRRAVYHAMLKRKYEQAAASPWLPVPPDPPPPL